MRTDDLQGQRVGWLKERPGRDGRKQYTAVYRDLRGRERSAGTFPSRRAANRAWQKAESDLMVGRVGDPKRGRQTLRHYVSFSLESAAQQAIATIDAE